MGPGRKNAAISAAFLTASSCLSLFRTSGTLFTLDLVLNLSTRFGTMRAPVGFQFHIIPIPPVEIITIRENVTAPNTLPIVIAGRPPHPLDEHVHTTFAESSQDAVDPFVVCHHLPSFRLRIDIDYSFPLRMRRSRRTRVGRLSLVIVFSVRSFVKEPSRRFRARSDTCWMIASLAE